MHTIVYRMISSPSHRAWFFTKTQKGIQYTHTPRPGWFLEAVCEVAGLAPSGRPAGPVRKVRPLLVQRRPSRKCIFRKCIFRKCIFRKFCKFLAGSFSAVSKRNFARKCAFDSIFQALQELHPFAPLQIQHFSKKSPFSRHRACASKTKSV